MSADFSDSLPLPDSASSSQEGNSPDPNQFPNQSNQSNQTAANSLFDQFPQLKDLADADFDHVISSYQEVLDSLSDQLNNKNGSRGQQK